MVNAPKRGGNAPGDSGDRDRKGRIKGRSKPNVQQRAFLQHLTEGLRIADAATAVGYAHPAVAGSKALASKTTRAIVQAGRKQRRDKARSLALYMSTLVMTGQLQVTTTQWKAIEWYLDDLRDLEDDKSNDNSDLRGMTYDQLVALGSRIDKAEVVATVPELPADAVQVIDNNEQGSP